MITKERLEELIEHHKTIYTTYGGYVSEINLHKKYDYTTDNYLFEADIVAGEVGYRKYPFNMLFETQEKAEWYREFGCIERTERLELPTWEEFKNKKIKEVCFIGGDTICFYELYEDTKNNRLILLDHDCDYEYFNEPLTKENYTLACRKAKEIFLGEKK